MTATDLAVRDAQATAIPAKLQYARALAESGLLPASYRKNPANVLWAMEYGDMLGLAPMATMTGVHVIEGKPTASAGLISALVRQAGHKLRVDGDNKSATCVITRSDDPKPFSVTWTLKKDGSNPSAEEAKLLSKPVWQQYPASMLKSRAITQCARDACEEVLFGLHYTPEELGANVDEDGVIVEDPPAAQPRGRGTIFIDPECLVENEQSQLAERSGGTPQDDQWYVRPEPAPDSGTPDDGQPWTDQAIGLAANLKSEQAAGKLWRETAAKLRTGEITDEDASKIGDLIQARVADLRRQVYDQAMSLLSEDEPWRDKIGELADEDEARAALEELGQLMTAKTIDAKRGNRISHAIVAKFPRATDVDREVA